MGGVVHNPAVLAARTLARRQWAETTLTRHLDVDGACAVCAADGEPSTWPCTPARTAFIFLGVPGASRLKSLR